MILSLENEEVQVNLFQKHLFLHQLTHDMKKRLFIELQVQYMKIASSEHSEKTNIPQTPTPSSRQTSAMETHIPGLKKCWRLKWMVPRYKLKREYKSLDTLYEKKRGNAMMLWRHTCSHTKLIIFPKTIA